MPRAASVRAPQSVVATLKKVLADAVSSTFESSELSTAQKSENVRELNRAQEWVDDLVHDTATDKAENSEPAAKPKKRSQPAAD
jgi:hypothetical protein